MGFLSWIALGLSAGWTAKLVLPGRDPGGMTATAALGVAGALFGGLLGTALGLGSETGFDVPSFFLAAFCSIAVLFGFRLFVDRSKA